MRSVKQVLASQLRHLSIDDDQFFSKLYTHIETALHGLNMRSLEVALQHCRTSQANKEYIRHLHRFIEQKHHGEKVDFPEAVIHSKDNFYEVIIEQVIDMFELIETAVDAD